MLEINLMTGSAAGLVTGLASIHFANLSTATRRYLNPPGAVFNGPTMSRHHTTKVHVMGIIFRLVASKFDLLVNL